MSVQKLNKILFKLKQWMPCYVYVYVSTETE